MKWTELNATEQKKNELIAELTANENKKHLLHLEITFANSFVELNTTELNYLGMNSNTKLNLNELN